MDNKWIVTGKISVTLNIASRKSKVQGMFSYFWTKQNSCNGLAISEGKRSGTVMMACFSLSSPNNLQVTNIFFWFPAKAFLMLDPFENLCAEILFRNVVQSCLLS